MSRIHSFIYSILFLLCYQSGNGQGTQLLRQPSLSGDHIVFVYANDLWIVDRGGSDARRLTSNEGNESFPHFSNDGSQIAFSAQYGGNTDVYVIDATGGNPKRLTYHPGADVVQGWTPGGEIIFRSGRNGHPTETNSMYTVDTGGGFPQAMNVTRAAYGELSADGQYLAYTPITTWDPEWRNYRGGQAMPIWIQDMNTGALERTPRTDNERHLDPVWMGSKVYYLSERDFVSNIWSYDIETKQEEQVTFHKLFDIKSLDAHGNDIIYEQGGYLHLLEGGSGEATQLSITVKGDMNFALPRWEDVRGNNLTNPALSPNGKRAIFEHRGEILTVPKEHGSFRNLTNSSGVADRSPVWSPKGDRLAWFSDASGEYALIIADQFGANQKSMSVPAGTYYFRPDWSPDGNKIAFTDTDYNIWYVDLESGMFKNIATDRYAHPNRSMNPSWSPDSRYITFAKQQDSHFKSIFIYDTETSETHQVTDPLADITAPVFDQDGGLLYFLASTDYGLASGWLDMSSYDPSVSRTLYVSVLHADGKSPLLPKSDEEEVEEASEEDDDGSEEESDETEEGEGSEDEEEEEKEIDFEGIQSRIIPVSKVRGDYVTLMRGPAGSVLVAETGDNGFTVKKYTLEDDELDTFVGGVNNMTTSYDGKYALYRQGGNWSISSTAGKPNKEKDGLSLGIKVKVDPMQEYHQIFREGWRFMRDFLYVENVHGAPWDKVWEWYSPWINHVRHRSDLNYVVDIMSGEVAIGHSYTGGGDMPDIDRVGVGLLGADYALDDTGYRIEKIYTGEQWNPNLKPPLFAPGLDVKEGDYITSVNGRSVSATDNVYSFFEETAGKQVRLGVRTGDEEERIAVVVPVSNEFGLRLVDWVEGNRRKVDELSDGQLAYVYVPNTAGNGFTSFNRYYFSQQDKKGVIIDERNNGGGSAADYMIDIMSRKLFGYFNSKAGDKRPWTTPMAGIWGPKVMIINERAGSGGDLLPYMFRANNLGPLVGTRTWGGLVGTWDTPPFIDGGRMVAPRGGFFDVDGEWAVEGEGIAPDIEVIMDPQLVLQGRDPQLERAVEEALKLLETERFEMKPEPAPPVKWKRPAGWENKE